MNFLNGLKKLPDFLLFFPIHKLAKDFTKKIIYGGRLSSTLKLSELPPIQVGGENFSKFQFLIMPQ